MKLIHFTSYHFHQLIVQARSQHGKILITQFYYTNNFAFAAILPRTIFYKCWLHLHNQFSILHQSTQPKGCFSMQCFCLLATSPLNIVRTIRSACPMTRKNLCIFAVIVHSLFDTDASIYAHYTCKTILGLMNHLSFLRPQ